MRTPCLILIALSAACSAPASGTTPFAYEEATIEGLQSAMTTDGLTARRLAELYLRRIDRLDHAGPELRSVIEVNPDALAIADALDAERRATGPRGPLHGIPILIKDNIDTADRMMTTAGSLALVGPAPARDAFVVERLRAAGAVILGKTNLSEWANIRSSKSTSGWSARGGLVRNPYALDRNACGSSSGTGAAIAANLAAAGVGTETDGSIVCPSSLTGLVGLKPTVGLVSRSGIVPISHSQDTAGPMTRSVADAAILLAAMRGEDPRDLATTASAGRRDVDLSAGLGATTLAGLRLGVLRGSFSGYSAPADAVFSEAVSALKALGAEVIDPVELPNAGAYGDDELTVLLYELKADMHAYLSTRAGVPVKTLADIIAFNQQHADRELMFFGQELFLEAEKKGPLTESAYRDALSRSQRLARAEGIDRVLQAHRLDALVALTTGPAWQSDLINGDAYLGSSSTPAAVAGYPAITVPAGQVRGLPVGLSIFSTAWTEPMLLRIAAAFERATHHRAPPSLTLGDPAGARPGRARLRQ